MPRKKRSRKEEVYHVEAITRARVSEDGEWEYFVKWAGYDSDADSWEPTENVQQCERLLASFWKHIGMDNEDYHVGYEVAAEESWINKEKRYFAEKFVKPSERKSDCATENQRTRSQSTISEESTMDDFQSSDEQPPAKTSAKRPKKARVVDSESESDDHLHKEVEILSKVTIPPAKKLPKVPPPAKRRENPSEAGSSLPVAVPRIVAVRTHQDQRSNPLVKSMDLPSTSVGAGSSLSTKQRVAAGILPPATGPKPLPPGPKKSLTSLSFKKNKPPILPHIQMKDTVAPSASTATPTSQSTDFINNMDVVTSQPMDVDIYDSILEDMGTQEQSHPDISIVPILPKTRDVMNAEEFLNTIDLPGLSGPLDMDVVTNQPIQPSFGTPKTPAIPKIPKKWKWIGELFISTSESRTELLCAVTITDPDGISNSSHINLLLSSLDSLWIQKLYSIMDLPPLLRACGKPQYFGRLESNEPSDGVIVDGLYHHLTSEELVVAIPLLLDGTEVAVLLLFPGAQKGLTNVLQVPEHLLYGTPFLAVLSPFLVPVTASTKTVGRRSIGAVQQSLLNLQDDLMSHDTAKEVVLFQAMSLLHFPQKLLDFLKSYPTSASYCIWPMSDESSDTIMLQYILKSTKAVSAKVEEDVRFVFISNGHLEELYTMPSLVTKRANFPQTQFWTYGCSSDIACRRWRLQEIYPLGGIVTFTSSALVENMTGCYQLISQIMAHPLWDCFVIPEVLAVCHMLSSNWNASSSSESCLDPILDLISHGLISAMRMPRMGEPDQVAWLSQVFTSSSIKYKMLDGYIEVLRNHNITSVMTAEQLITFTNNEVIKDLLRAQIQPAFMDNYRRFVVIKAASDDAIPFDKDGLEWSSLSHFSFKDDHFQP